MIRIASLVTSAAIIICSLLSHQAFASTPQAPLGNLSTTRARQTLVVSQRRTCGSCGLTVHFVTSASNTTVQIRSHIKNVEDVRILSNGLALIVGHVDDRASAITVFDPSTGDRRIDAFCYRPSVSPDGRYLVFLAFYPEHFIPSEKTYDRVSFLDLRHSFAFEGFRDTDLRGSSVFPRDDEFNRLQSGFSWSGDKVTFETLYGDRFYYISIAFVGSSYTVSRDPLRHNMQQHFYSSTADAVLQGPPARMLTD